MKLPACLSWDSVNKTEQLVKEKTLVNFFFYYFGVLFRTLSCFICTSKIFSNVGILSKEQEGLKGSVALATTVLDSG